MPIFNRIGMADAAIQSVRNQDCGDFELIIYDDGSDASTKAMLQRHAVADARIRVTHGPHIGLIQARLECHRQARGEFVGWIDSDDLLMPSCLRETVAYLDAHPECGMVYTDHLLTDGPSSHASVGRRTTIPYSSTQLLVDFMVFHFRLFRRSVYEAVGGLDPAFELAQDYDLVLRMSEHTAIHHLPRPLYVYRLHRNNESIRRRVDQIEASARAVRNALRRRGMDNDYALEVEIHERFRLVRKAAPQALKHSEERSCNG